MVDDWREVFPDDDDDEEEFVPDCCYGCVSCSFEIPEDCQKYKKALEEHQERYRQSIAFRGIYRVEVE